MTRERLLASMDDSLRKALDDLVMVEGVAIDCDSDKVNALHLLIAMLEIPDGIAWKVFHELEFDVRLLVNKLRERCVKGLATAGPCGDDAISFDTALSQELERLCEPDRNGAISETDMVLASLDALDDTTRKTLQDWAGCDLEHVKMLVRRRGIHSPTMSVVEDDGRINLAAFTQRGRAALELAHRESMALGLDVVSHDVLVLSMLESNGTLATAMRAQGVDLRAITGTLQQSLKPSRRIRASQYPLDTDHCRQVLINILEQAALLATQEGRILVDEPHIVVATMGTQHGLSRQILIEMKIDVMRVVEFAELAARQDMEEESNEMPVVVSPSMQDIATALSAKVFGQEQAIAQMTPLLNRFAYGYRREAKPGGMFLFMGRSGTGKTLMAKALATALYGSEDALITIEMGSFLTEYSYTQLIGAPPGLKGYGDGQLTNGLRDHPNSVVLFDEVEKAKPEIYDVLLRFLDEGIIRDPAGPIRDGTNCMIVFTSNINADELDDLIEERRDGLSSDEVQAELRKCAIRFFKRQELVNRMDELVLFNPLGRAELRQLAQMQLAKEMKWFSTEKKIDLVVEEAVTDLIVDNAVDRVDEGGRVIGKIFTNMLISPLIDYLLRLNLQRDATVRVMPGSGNSLRFEGEKSG